MRRAIVVQVALGSTVLLRLVAAARAAEHAREEDASIDGSGVEGNARVVGGFVSTLFRLEMWLSVLHAAAAFLVVASLVRVIRMEPAESAAEWLRRVLAVYFWLGAAIAVVVAPLTFGFGVATMVMPLTLGWWGALVPGLAILVPAAAAWQVRRSGGDDQESLVPAGPSVMARRQSGGA